ncbi:MAG: hypothetical protein LH469_01385, partial [Frankiaceae bacterium]|nr:hypothetical protein [Frankiaceae bacterium]
AAAQGAAVPVGPVALTSATVAQGGNLTGTITGDFSSVTVSGCGLTSQTIGADDNATTAGRQFTLTVAASQATGNCTLTFTATPTGGGAAVVQTVPVNVTAAPASTGPVTLASTSAPQGGSLTGSIANPGTIQSVSLTGCGFNNQNVPVSGAGAFSLTLPAGQTTGACSLSFSVLRTDGTTTTQVVPFTVTAIASSTTAAPDLVSATVNAATGVVTYSFDEDVTGNLAVPADFYVYDAAGVETLASNAQVNGTTVIAQFGTAIAAGATLAAVADDAVSDAAGTRSYAASAPLSVQTQAAAVTDGPDLQTVDNLRVLNGVIVADFRFDEPVSRTDRAALLASGDFALIANDGSIFLNAAGVPVFSVDNRTLTVAFQTDTAQLPIGSIVRGVVGAAAVDDGSNANVVQTEPRTGVPAFTTGVIADRTDDPDVVSVAVAGTNTIAFTFDEAVQGDGTFTLGSFFVYDSTSNTIATAAGGSAARSTVSTSVVNVTFPTGVVATAVGAGVLPSAVRAVDDGAPNQTQELPLQSVVNSAGRTAIADLVSVTISSDAFGNNRVVYTFDSAPTNAATSVFTLVDANGTVFSPADADGDALTTGTNGAVVGNTVVFQEAAAATIRRFTDAQASAAVVGNVEDTTGTGTASTITTGDVSVTR